MHRFSAWAPLCWPVFSARPEDIRQNVGASACGRVGMWARLHARKPELPMRHFQKIAEGLNVTPVLDALMRNPDLWDANTLRTKHPGRAHAEVSDIWVWFNDPAGDVANDREVIPYPAWQRLPQLRPLVLDLMRAVEGVRLGRVLITRLPAGRRITPHVDGGAPAEYFTRYQIALQSLSGALFRIDDETVNFRTGEVWQIDNRSEHEVINNSADDRVALIVDIRNG